MIKKMAAGMFAAALASAPAHAFPTGDITILIPFSPGGGFDTVVRRLAPRLSETLGVEVIPTNMPGAAGRRAASALMSSAPDGHTLMIFNIPGHGLDYIRDVDTDFDISTVTWVAQVGEDRYVALAASTNEAIRSVEDVKAKGSILIPELGPTSTSHIANQIAWTTLGVEPNFITGYSSSQDAATAVLRGDGDLMMVVAGSALRYNEAGDYTVLAEFSPASGTRLFPDVPNGEALGHPELDQLGLIRAIAGPPGMPEDVVQILSDAFVAAVNHPETQAWAEETQNPMIALDAAAAREAVFGALDFHRQFGHLVVTD